MGTLQHTSFSDRASVGAPSRLLDGCRLPLSNSSSLSASTAEGLSVPHDRERIGRNDRRDTSRNVRAFTITQGELLELTQEAFREHVGPGPGGAKKIAGVVECSEKTAQNWLDGKTTPSGILDLRAMHAIPAYAALKREIAQLEMDLDPRLQAKLRELHTLTMALSGGER